MSLLPAPPGVNHGAGIVALGGERLLVCWYSGRSEAVPDGLYRFAGGVSQPVVVRVNGQVVEAAMKNGYAVVGRKWKNGAESDQDGSLVSGYREEGRPQIWASPE